MERRATRRPMCATTLLFPMLLCVAAVIMPLRAGCAQTAAAPPDTVTPAPASGPTIVVLPFDFAAPLPAARRGRPPRWMAPPVMGRAPGGFGGLPAGRMMAAPAAGAGRGDRGAAGDDALTAGIGSGIATLLIERLLADGGFRVLERQHLDAVLAERALDSASRGAGARAAPRPNGGAADYIVTGSVVEFGTEESHALGGLGSLGGLGALGFKRPKTTVTLVARVVNATTGEVVLSLRGQGVSRKGAGVTLGGIARGGGGVVSVGSGAFRESALGQATDRAVGTLAERMMERRAALGAR